MRHAGLMDNAPLPLSSTQESLNPYLPMSLPMTPLTPLLSLKKNPWHVPHDLNEIVAYQLTSAKTSGSWTTSNLVLV